MGPQENKQDRELCEVVDGGKVSSVSTLLVAGTMYLRRSYLREEGVHSIHGLQAESTMVESVWLLW